MNLLIVKKRAASYNPGEGGGIAKTAYWDIHQDFKVA